MEFGLGAYLEKFEQHFGPRWTKALLIVVGVAIFSAAIAAAVKLLLLPLWAILAPVIPRRWTWGTTFNAFFLCVQLGGGFALGSFMLDAYRKRLATSQLEDLVPRAEEMYEETQRLYKNTVRLQGEVKKANEQSQDILSSAILTSEELIAVGLRKGFFTQEQADQLQSLRDIALEERQ